MALYRLLLMIVMMSSALNGMVPEDSYVRHWAKRYLPYFDKYDKELLAEYIKAKTYIQYIQYVYQQEKHKGIGIDQLRIFESKCNWAYHLCTEYFENTSLQLEMISIDATKRHANGYEHCMQAFKELDTLIPAVPHHLEFYKNALSEKETICLQNAGYLFTLLHRPDENVHAKCP